LSPDKSGGSARLLENRKFRDLPCALPVRYVGLPVRACCISRDSASMHAWLLAQAVSTALLAGPGARNCGLPLAPLSPLPACFLLSVAGPTWSLALAIDLARRLALLSRLQRNTGQSHPARGWGRGVPIHANRSSYLRWEQSLIVLSICSICNNNILWGLCAASQSLQVVGVPGFCQLG
jgi:hypothetical protein